MFREKVFYDCTAAAGRKNAAGEIIRDALRYNKYEAIGNSKLDYKETRFPLLPLLNGYAERDEKIRIIAAVPNTPQCFDHLDQLKEEVAELQEEKGFLCDGVESFIFTYSGDVNAQIELFQKLLYYMEDNDTLYACLTYGNKPMPIAELMALQYGYRVMNNVSIGCLVYGEVDHSAVPKQKTITDRATGKPRVIDEYPMRIFDITALIQLDEIVRLLADQKVKKPKKFLDRILEL